MFQLLSRLCHGAPSPHLDLSALHDPRSLLSGWKSIAFATSLFALTPNIAQAQAMQNHIAPVPSSNVAQTGVDEALPIVAVTAARSGSTKAGTSGHLVLDRNSLTFKTKKHSDVIGLGAIRAYEIDHTSRPMLRGAVGFATRLLPYGGGQLTNALREGAETLTIVYVDEQRYKHAYVFVVNSSAKPQLERFFSRSDVANDGAMSVAGEAFAPSPAPAIASAAKSVQVGFPTSKVDDLPLAYRAAIYEDTLHRLTKSTKTAAVVRDFAGTTQGRSSALSIDITKARFGDATVRNVLPLGGFFSGKTLLEAQVEYRTEDGAVAFSELIEGSKRTPGEDMGATSSLAGRIDSAVKKGMKQL